MCVPTWVFSVISEMMYHSSLGRWYRANCGQPEVGRVSISRRYSSSPGMIVWERSTIRFGMGSMGIFLGQSCLFRKRTSQYINLHQGEDALDVFDAAVSGALGEHHSRAGGSRLAQRIRPVVALHETVRQHSGYRITGAGCVHCDLSGGSGQVGLLGRDSQDSPGA